MDSFTFDGKDFDIIEVFDQFILVQELDTGKIYLLDYDVINQESVVKLEGKIISLKDWVCQKRNGNTKK